MFLQLLAPLGNPDHLLALAAGLAVEVLILACVLVPQGRVLEQLKRELRKLEQSSYLDPLTGLRSGAIFREELDELGRLNESVVVLYIDLDDFGRFNELGHRAGGDRALRLAADTLKKSIRRKSDRLYRLHGDEFAAVLPNASEEQAAACAHAMIYSLRIEKLSATIGVAASQRVGWQNLEETADQACLTQKKRAKGSFLFATPELAANWSAQLRPGQSLGRRVEALATEVQT